MPLFISDVDLKHLAGDSSSVAARADAYIRNLHLQLDTVQAASTAAEQKYMLLYEEFSKLESQHAQLQKSVDAQVQAGKQHLLPQSEKERIERHNEELTAKDNSLVELRRTHADLKADMSTKLSDVNKVVELYKEASDEWSRKAGELEGVIKALEIHLSQVENHYKDRLEMEESSRKQLRKDLERSRKASVLNLLPLSSVKSDRSSTVLKLKESFQMYKQSKFGENVDYGAYLTVFPQLDRIPRKLKRSRYYRNYLDSLLRQMKSFFESTHPGQNLNSLLNEVAGSFESHWLKGTVNGCENPSRQNACVHHLWAKEYDLENPAVTLDGLLQVGRPRLVALCLTYGLKLGGLESELADRLITLRDPNSSEAQLKKITRKDKGKKTAWMETAVKILCCILDEAIDRTKRYVMEQMKNAKEQMLEARYLQKSCIEWDPDTEEFEDADGNVYDRRTYMELRLQGLL